jgi:hypothetical protein
MPRSFVELSIHFENDVLSEASAFAQKIEYSPHDTLVPPEIVIGRLDARLKG